MTPKMVADTIALREAGYTVLAISQRLGVSMRTLQRHLAAHGAKKGRAKAEVVDRARTALLDRVTTDATIREEAARLIEDDLAHARHLREVIAKASEHMAADGLRDAVLVMRAAAAYSTALKNTSDMLRHSLRLDRLEREADDQLPELVVRELSPADLAGIEAAQGLASPHPNVDDLVDVDEPEGADVA